LKINFHSSFSVLYSPHSNGLDRVINESLAAEVVEGETFADVVPTIL